VIRVLVVDDQALIRGGLAALINSADDLEVVGEAENGADALRLIRAHDPDVVLMDIRMPTMDGIAATEALALHHSSQRPKVIVLTTFDLDEYVYAALRAGASGFLLKDTPPQDLLQGIRVVAAGDSLLAPSITRHLIEQYVQRPTDERPSGKDFERLTEREVEVLRLVARGLSNQEIGEELFVSPATAKTHVSRLLMKLAARDRTQLIVLAYETGLVKARPR
jgi:DNA-binding NarL/FixJ family response regulator